MEAMRAMPPDSFDAVVTDPPYELTSGGKTGFMGKAWDGTGISFRPELWAEVYRVARPGAVLLSFGGTRTSHRIACAIEDAGWTIGDTLMWCFGSGFPKHKSKLKPAHEPIILATKPGPKWLGVDACRVGTTDDLNGGCYSGGARPTEFFNGLARKSPGDFTQPAGRWPPNVAFQHNHDCIREGVARVKGIGNHVGRNRDASEDSKSYSGRLMKDTRDGGYADADGLETVDAWACTEGCPVKELDRQSGRLTSGSSPTNHGFRRNKSIDSKAGVCIGPRKASAGTLYSDSGGASRFYPCFAWESDDFFPFRYQAKASRRERNAGVESKNIHPTVKPLALLSWLCRLACPPGGAILDPFAGSGTTLIAAHREGFDATGIEQSPEYVAIAEARIKHHVREHESRLPILEHRGTA